MPNYADLARTRAWVEQLDAFPTDKLSEVAALNREIVTYSLRNSTVAPAEGALGDRFDIRQFHDVLKSGAMPLTVMERLIETRTKGLLL